jgi:hypothetical protein
MDRGRPVEEPTHDGGTMKLQREPTTLAETALFFRFEERYAWGAKPSESRLRLSR